MLNCFLYLVNPPRLYGYTYYLVELIVLEASFKHSVNHSLHLWINNDISPLVVMDLDSFFNVLVNTFMDESVHILRFLIQIEFLACFQCKSQSLFMFFKVIVDFRGNRSGKFPLWESMVIWESLSINLVKTMIDIRIYLHDSELIWNFMPSMVDDIFKFL